MAPTPGACVCPPRPSRPHRSPDRPARSRWVTAHVEIPQELFASDWALDITDVSAEVVGVLRGLEATEAIRPYFPTAPPARDRSRPVLTLPALTEHRKRSGAFAMTLASAGL